MCVLLRGNGHFTIFMLEKVSCAFKLFWSGFNEAKETSCMHDIYACNTVYCRQVKPGLTGRTCSGNRRTKNKDMCFQGSMISLVANPIWMRTCCYTFPAKGLIVSRGASIGKTCIFLHLDSSVYICRISIFIGYWITVRILRSRMFYSFELGSIRPDYLRYFLATPR